MYLHKLVVAAAAGTTGFLMCRYKLNAESDVPKAELPSNSDAPTDELIATRIAVIGSGIGGSSAVHFLRYISNICFYIKTIFCYSIMHICV